MNREGLLEGESCPLEKYANRQVWQSENKFPGLNIMNMSIQKFESHIDLARNSIRTHPEKLVVRVLQQYSSNPTNPIYPLYCKYRVLQFKVWNENPEFAFLQYDNNEAGWVSTWRDYLNSLPADVRKFTLKIFDINNIFF